MSIVFGNLTEGFVKFGTAIQGVSDGTMTEADVQTAAAGFRHTASHDALILVYIGIGALVATFISMYVWVYTGEVTSKRIRERYFKVRDIT